MSQYSQKVYFSSTKKEIIARNCVQTDIVYAIKTVSYIEISLIFHT